MLEGVKMRNLNYHCRWRLDLAKEISQKIKAIRGTEGIAAIVVGGSVARGYADEYSDVEIPIFWNRLPSEATRKLIIKELNGEFFYPYNHGAREDNILINGFKVDFWHITLGMENEVIDSVYKESQIDYFISNAIDTIRTCIPLYGESIVDSWKAKVKEYPRKIGVKTIEKALRTIDCTQADLYLQRNNPTLVYELITNLQRSMFIILLGINKEYFPTFKWMYKALEGFEIKPVNIEERFREIFKMQPDKALESTLHILNEVLYLVDTVYPEIDTSMVLKRLKSSRMVHYFRTVDVTGNLKKDVAHFLKINHKPGTIDHVIKVAETSMKLAERFNADGEKCYKAGLIHDISVVINPKDMRTIADFRNMEIDPAEEKYPFLLHQRISRIIARDYFNITDEDILSAVECHTTLKKNPTKYEMILFLADKIAWDQAGTPPFLDVVMEGLDISLEAGCKNYINYVYDNNMLLYPHRWMEEAHRYN